MLPDFLQCVYAIVDGTSCLVEAEYADIPVLQKTFCFGPSPSIKYIVCVRLADGKIVFNSNWEPGAQHDITAFRNTGLIELMEAHELLLADLGFIGEKDYCLVKNKAHKGIPLTCSALEYNIAHSGFRITIESTFARVLTFKCLALPWRHGLSQHRHIFNLICRLVNIDLDFRPLFYCLKK